MGVYQIYFSPTGGTKRAQDVVAGVWDGDKTMVDLSSTEEDFSRYAFHEEDVCIVAVPSFGGRVPECALSRISRMHGGNARAIMMAVFGNRAYEDTLLELEDTLVDRGFRCVAAIAAVAEHSIMHQFGSGRPDGRDEEELKGFASKIRAALEEGRAEDDIRVPGNVPFRTRHVIPFMPKGGGKCTRCGRCASCCPVAAIPKEDPSSVIEERCISCMRCVSICPKQARKLNQVMLFAASCKLQKACESRKGNELFLKS